MNLEEHVHPDLLATGRVTIEKFESKNGSAEIVMYKKFFNPYT